MRSKIEKYMQTDGFVALGEMPNDQRLPCLVCKKILETIVVQIFVPEPDDIPATLRLPGPKKLVIPYRLCPNCYRDNKPAPWKLRLLILERLNALMELCK
jgi:hypothetical protein